PTRATHLLLRCFSCSHTHPPPRPPHSFPTRRSSDLDLDHAQRVFELARVRTQSNLRALCKVIVEDPRLKSTLATEGMDEATVAEDRKSTRLNSSHGSISYAVFCLKKKKTTTKEEQYL